MRDVRDQPFVNEGQITGLEHDDLGVVCQPVVFRVEDVVNRSEANVLIGTAVSGDEVRIEQFVVVEPVRDGPSPIVEANLNVAVGDTPSGSGVVGNIGEEGVARRHGAFDRDALAPIGRRVALNEDSAAARRGARAKSDD